VLLVSYDAAMTAPMDELLPITDPTATAWILSAGSPQRTPALASFDLQFEEANGSSTTPLPAWVPARWAAQSSARALAALGLLDADDDAVYRCTLGGLILCLRRIERERT
jgi:hypothetical protein